MIEKINNAKSFDELIPFLEELHTACNGILDGSDVSLERVEETVTCIIQIRSLITEIGNLLQRATKDKKCSAVIMQLRNDYLALEGKVKEIRNDMHARERKSA